MKCPHLYHLAVLKERHFPLDFCWISVISGLHFLCHWYSQCVQTWLCGRSAIRCAPLTAQIIAIHHLFTHSFGKSSCFTPWNYNVFPRPRKVNVSCVFFFLVCTLKMLSQVRIDLWSVTHFRWYANGRSLFCLWFTPCLFLFVKMWRWKGDYVGVRELWDWCYSARLLMSQETFVIGNVLRHKLRFKNKTKLNNYAQQSYGLWKKKTTVSIKCKKLT